MSKYFKVVKSYEDLKNQYKKLLKANHPDNGGDLEAMKEINVEYDALFAVWKNKKEVETGEEINETADSTRSQFYTMFGWEGSNHDWNRSLKEVAQIVRTYVKEKYPTYKFSVRTSYASMCQELHVTLKESPVEIYKTFEELDNDDFREISKRLFMWGYNDENRINFLNASAEEKKKTIEESNSKYAHILNDVTRYNFIKTAPTKQKIKLYREKKWKDKVYYYILFYSVNLTDGHEELMQSIKYTGQERRKAIEDFEKLQKEKKNVIFEKDIEKRSWER